jgi:L-asparaginase II
MSQGMTPDESSSTNPILLKMWRGSEVECWHRGAFCVVDGSGVVAGRGDPNQRVYVRSGAKFFQALANLKTGIAESYSLNERHLALMCASHGGEPEHVAVAEEILRLGGLSPDALQCGTHYPLHPKASGALRQVGVPANVLHNNCSGKHGGMLLAAKVKGEPIESYLDPAHPRQVEMKNVFAQFAGVSADRLGVYVDGCSAPTFATTLKAAAMAFRNFGCTKDIADGDTAERVAQLKGALRSQPFLLGGSQRFCTDLIVASQGRVLGKVGAAGFYGAFHEELGLGVALHVDDGNADLAEGLMGRLLHHLGWIDDQALLALARYCNPERTNHRGILVGKSEALF